MLSLKYQITNTAFSGHTGANCIWMQNTGKIRQNHIWVRLPLCNQRTYNSFICLWHNGDNEYLLRKGGKKFIIIRADEFPDRFWMGIIGDASGPFLAWKMVVIWLDERRWGPPPRPKRTGAEEPRAGCINEQAVLKGTGSCNADEWSLQSRDGRGEQKGKREEGRGGEEWSEVGKEAAAVGEKKALICTSDFCKLIYHVSSSNVHRVSSLSTLYISTLHPHLLVSLHVFLTPAMLMSTLKFDGLHSSCFSCLTSFYGLIE